MSISIRKFTVDDAEATARLFFESVRNDTAAHYTEAQRCAWAPSVPNLKRWCARLLSMSTYVAEDDARIAGFMTLEPDGHIDFAYVRPDLIGTGVGRQLYVSVSNEALALGISRLYSEASDLARPFFERQGWILLASQTVTRNGVSMTNHQMDKRLN